MSIRLSGTGQYYRRNTNLPTSTGFTSMWWARANAGDSCMFVYGDLDANPQYNVGFSGLQLGLYSGTFTGGSTLSTGTWYHIALTVNGTSGANALVYLNGVLDASGTAVTITSSTIRHGSDYSSGAFNGNLYAIKTYSAILTAAEIQQEMRQVMPVRTANLNDWRPFFSAADFADYSGAANTTTTVGTPTTEDLTPPIPWRAARPARVYIAGATSTYTLTAAAGSFTESGIAAALRAARTLALVKGTFTESGIAAGLNKGFTLTALVGAFDPGPPPVGPSFMWTGKDATLTYSGGTTHTSFVIRHHRKAGSIRRRRST